LPHGLGYLGALDDGGHGFGAKRNERYLVAVNVELDGGGVGGGV
jgi:hypothetical protein